MPYTEIVDAVATSACNAAVDESGKLLCESFTAETEEWEEHATDSTKAYLVKTGQTVRVFHKDPNQGMAVGDRISIGRLSDGRWEWVAWLCEAS